MAKFFERNKAHKKIQREGPKRDGYICMICGQYNEKGQGHHVIPLFVGGPSFKFNIITMCPECHKDYHRGKLKIDLGSF